MTLYKLGSDKIYFGENATENLSTIEGQRAFIVMSGDILTKLGLTQTIIDPLVSAGFEIRTYEDVEPDPSFDAVYRGAQAMIEFEPDWVIGFGGGSAMDAAKVMWAIYENPELNTVEKLIANESITHLRHKARLCCIPTTAGTGSEVTRAAVIKDLKSNTKYPVKDMKLRLMADIAILDPKMTMTMPRKLLAASGMDALTHSIESFVAVNRNQFSEMLSMQAFKLVSDSLLKSYENMDLIEPRYNLLAGSSIAGMAFSNSGLGICHSIAHAFGGQLGVPHGLANAIVLPYVMKYLGAQNEIIESRYKYLAQQIDEENLVVYIESLNQSMDIPSVMKDVINIEHNFSEVLETLVTGALNDVCTTSSIVKPSYEDMEYLIELVYFGK